MCVMKACIDDPKHGASHDMKSDVDGKIIVLYLS